MLAIIYIISGVFALIMNGDVRSSRLRFGSVGLLTYVAVGGGWWRVLFQDLDDHRHDPETEAADRRLQRTGSVVWIVLAYVVCYVELLDVSRGSGDDDSGTSVIGLVLVLLLPLGLAWVTAVSGRYRATWASRRHR